MFFFTDKVIVIADEFLKVRNYYLEGKFSNKNKESAADKEKIAESEDDLEVIDTTTNECIGKTYKPALITATNIDAEVETLKMNSTVAFGINTGNAVFGAGKNAQAAARGEVSAALIGVVPLFEGHDYYSALAAGDIDVLNSLRTKLLSGDWSSLNYNITCVQDGTLRGELNTAKDVVIADAAIGNLVTAQLLGNGTDANGVRKDLLISRLAKKDVNATKAVIDN